MNEVEPDVDHSLVDVSVEKGDGEEKAEISELQGMQHRKSHLSRDSGDDWRDEADLRSRVISSEAPSTGKSKNYTERVVVPFVRAVSNFIVDYLPNNVILVIAIVVICGSIYTIASHFARHSHKAFAKRPSFVRPPSMENYPLDRLHSGLYDIASVSEKDDDKECIEKVFRCEFYTAERTSDGTDMERTYHCSFTVCAGATVKAAVSPESCSKRNQLAVAKASHDMYYSQPLAFSCSNNGCGDCSSVLFTASKTRRVSLLQGCSGQAACYGQVEVSISMNKKESGKSSGKQLRSVSPQARVSPYTSNSPSPKFRGNPSNSGVGARANNRLRLSWRFPMKQGFKSTPAIDANGNIYVGSEDHDIYCISSEGNIRWQFPTRAPVVSSPALASAGVVYVGSDDGNLYALRMSTGALVWTYSVGGKIHSSPSIGVDGCVYIGSHNGILHAVYPSGTSKWQFSVTVMRLLRESENVSSVAAGGSIVTSPTVSLEDGSIYFGTDDGHFVGIYANGELKFSLTVGSGIFSSAALSNDRKYLYFGCDSGHLYSISAATGRIQFRVAVGDRVRASPVVNLDGTIIFASQRISWNKIASESPVVSLEASHKGRTEGAGLFAVNPNGYLKWSIGLGGGTASSPVVSSDGIVFVSSDDHHLMAVHSASGKALANTKVTGRIFSSPVITADGRVVVGSWVSTLLTSTAYLYCYGAKLDEHSLPLEPGSARPSLSAEKEMTGVDLEWSCSGGYGLSGVMDAVCGAGLQVKSRRCLPGLFEYLGRGVDITYDINEANFLRGRALDFTSIADKVTLEEYDYVVPNSASMTTQVEGSTLSSDSLSSSFSSVGEFTHKRTVAMMLNAAQALYRPGSLPQSVVMTAMANVTAFRSDIAREVSESAREGKTLFVNSARFSTFSAYLSPITSTQSHVNEKTSDTICAASFQERLRQLPDSYDAEKYARVVREFGTHVIVSASIGGRILTVLSMDDCKASKYAVHRDVGTEINFLDAAGVFTTTSREASTVLLGHELKRSEQVIHGGHAEKYENKVEVNENPWDRWTKDLLSPSSSEPAALTLLRPELIPIWAFASPQRPHVKTHLAAAVLTYLRSVREEDAEDLDLSAQAARCFMEKPLSISSIHT